MVLDDVLMKAVVLGTVPAGVTAHDCWQCERALGWLRYEQGLLWAVSEGRWRHIPPLHERVHLVREVCTSLGFPGGMHLYHLLKERYFWITLQ